jgi:hypothetical protein
LQNLFPDKVTGHHFDYGEVNSFDVELIGLDGFIKIVAINSIPGNDSLFVKFFSPITDAQFQLYGGKVPLMYPIILPENEIYEEIVAFPSSDQIKIYWENINFFLFESANKDSISISRHDTSVYTINF